MICNYSRTSLRSLPALGGFLLGITCALLPAGRAVLAASGSGVSHSSREKAPTRFFSVKQIDDKWTFVDPDGRPFYSIGVDHVSTEGYIDPHGVNLYRETITGKYGTEDVWAKAQRERFREWGFNTIAAFSDAKPFVNLDIPFAVYIRVAQGNTDYFDPTWAAEARRKIEQAANTYGKERNLLGYFIDNELPWTLDYSALGRAGQELLVISRYFRYEYGCKVLLRFLEGRYPTLSDVRADFPDAKLTGTSWADLQIRTATLGNKVTPGGHETIDAWAQVMARQYFSVTSGALRAADPHHLNFGLKFLGGLTPKSVLKIEVPYVDVVSVDFYDTDAPKSTQSNEQAHPGDDHDTYPLQMIAALVDSAQMVSMNNMLSEWNSLSDKPVLIAEWSYRAADSGIPNTVPPFVKILPNDAERRRAIANFGQCAINTPYIVGIHWFELYDEPVAGRFDGENSNWGLVSGNDIPYPAVTAAFGPLRWLADQRLSGDYRPAPCKPLGAPNLTN